MKIISVVGARPNFMKIAPFIKAIKQFNEQQTNIYIGKQFSSHQLIEHILVNTGCHYDDRMSKAFFESLDIPYADINLSIGSGTHAEQVGKTMIAFEKVCIQEKPDWVIVVGDVNATLACSVTAKKLNTKLCHIEAGLRSKDLTMPEEINRLVTDRLSDLLLTPDILSSNNLRREGVSEHKIQFVGNIMIDTLEANREKASKIPLKHIIEQNIAAGSKLPLKVPDSYNYTVMTLHRPSNVDKKNVVEPIINFCLDKFTENHPLIWPIHPRTRKQLEKFDLLEKVNRHSSLILLEPLCYHDMLRLNLGARIMLTDSGGLQEECCVLGTPCLTLRWNTERPITLLEYGGMSVLVGNDVKIIDKEYEKMLNIKRNSLRPALWDGNTAQRCIDAILNYTE